VTSPFRHHSLRSPPTLPNRQSDNRHRDTPYRTRYQPVARSVFSRQHGRQRNPQTPSTATQLALDQGPHCKDSQHTPSARKTTAQACLSDVRHVIRVTQKTASRNFATWKQASAWKVRTIHGMHMLTLTSHAATTPRHRLPYPNDHGLPTCAQVQRLLCRPTTPHNHDHQRRMIHRLETPQELGNISLTHTQGPRWYRRHSCTNPHSA
jgi:hypothetical protein